MIASPLPGDFTPLEKDRSLQNNLHLHNCGFFGALFTSVGKWNSEIPGTQNLLTGSLGSHIIKENIDKGHKFLMESWTRTPSLTSSFPCLLKLEVSLLSSPANQVAKSAPESLTGSFQSRMRARQKSQGFLKKAPKPVKSRNKRSSFAARCAWKRGMLVLC